MNADELYLRSKMNRRYPIAKGMSSKAFLLACRNDLGNIEKGINKKKLLKVVETGEAWKMERIGKGIIKEWCEWLTKELS